MSMYLTIQLQSHNVFFNIITVRKKTGYKLLTRPTFCKVEENII